MATRSAKIDQKADLIWAIADKLTGVYKPHEYGDVILPLTVIRRFDCILSDTKDAVGFTKDAGDNSKVVMRKENIRNAFNSPMRPFVLATTSIGQEGLDFHNYCRVIMHWNLPSNPIDVGRILRTFKIKKNVEVTDNGKIII
ncbi:TPA: type I restriction-modification system subunit M N-terminal domain-containing protein [Enterococcus faecium]|nr:type I restriction-modification system subunit M N-terminal domain-containing protein [Enterococcus faecium]HBL2664796.1 type I restriction-modification system subunit M N-terminal domain-containing protein [Enterococcus faecium]